MANVNTEYLSRAESWLFITILAYFLLNGAQIFETAVLVPQWTAAPPQSFRFFKAPYAIDLKTFWIIAHTIHEVTFILAIVFCWKISPVRSWLLLLFLVHFMLRVWTLLYFAPDIIEFQAIANGKPYNSDLLIRTGQWKMLNYVRVAVFMAVSLGLIPLLVKLAGLKNG